MGNTSGHNSQLLCGGWPYAMEGGFTDVAPTGVRYVCLARGGQRIGLVPSIRNLSQDRLQMAGTSSAGCRRFVGGSSQAAAEVAGQNRAAGRATDPLVAVGASGLG